MIIKGLQKITLLDFPGKVACTVFTAGCNFRCPFCHNASLVTHTETAKTIPEEEIFAYLSHRRGILDGVGITGGEPLLQKDIAEFCRKIHDLGLLVKLDTNGSFPERLRDLIDQGLIDYVAMDIKNCKEAYAETCGLRDMSAELPKIEESIRLLMQSGIPYEFRTTVCKNLLELKDFEEIGQMLIGAKKYYLQKFVSSKHIDETYTNATTYNDDEFTQIKNILSKYVEQVYIR